MTDRTHTQTEVKATVERVVDVQPNAHKWEPEAARAYYHAEVDALVAAAYEVAAQACEEIRQRQIRLSMAEKACFDQEQAIRALTPSDARSALRAHTEAAVMRALEAAAAACRKQAEQFKSDEYATGQPVSSFSERFGCAQCEDAIRALDPAQFIGGGE